MIFTDTDTVLVLLTAQIDERRGPPGDWLALVAVTADGKLKAEYRFRYSMGDGFCEADKIKRYTLDLDDTPDTRARILSMFREIMRDGPFLDQRETPINGPVDKLKEALLNTPDWAIKMDRIQSPKPG